MKILFFGTSEFAVIILEKMIQGGLTPSLVVTTPDKPSGRKNIPTPSPVKVLASARNLTIAQPERIQDAYARLLRMAPDITVLASYGQIVPKNILDIATHGAINVHPSLLPKYRGATPVQSAILAGEKTTGVTIMRMDEEIDHGPILAQRTVPIARETYQELHNKLAVIGADLLIKTIPKWIRGELKAKEQNHTLATFTRRLSKEDGHIDETQDAEYIERQIRAFYPWPGAYTFWQGKRIKILKAHLEQEKLVIDKLQLEGKNPTTFREFLLGHTDFHVGPQ